MVNKVSFIQFNNFCSQLFLLQHVMVLMCLRIKSLSIEIFPISNLTKAFFKRCRLCIIQNGLFKIKNYGSIFKIYKNWFFCSPSSMKAYMIVWIKMFNCITSLNPSAFQFITFWIRKYSKPAWIPTCIFSENNVDNLIRFQIEYFNFIMFSMHLKDFNKSHLNLLWYAIKLVSLASLIEKSLKHLRNQNEKFWGWWRYESQGIMTKRNL